MCFRELQASPFRLSSHMQAPLMIVYVWLQQKLEKVRLNQSESGYDLGVTHSKSPV